MSVIIADIRPVDRVYYSVILHMKGLSNSNSQEQDERLSNNPPATLALISNHANKNGDGQCVMYRASEGYCHLGQEV